MDLVICMAGQNTRFHDVGVDIPKYLLPIEGKSVIQLILSNLLDTGAFSQIHLVAHERDIYFKELLIQSLADFSVGHNQVHYIGETKGQAETASLAIRLINSINPENPVVFHNADTVLYNRDYSKFRSDLNSGIGVIDVFEAQSPAYSYVVIQDELVVDIAEKSVISNWATSGLYGFSSSATYETYFQDLQKNQYALKDLKREIYISDVVKVMIQEGYKFKPYASDKAQPDARTVVLGSPAEYNSAVSNLGLL